MKHRITSLNNKGSEYNILANRNITLQGADSQTERLAKEQCLESQTRVTTNMVVETFGIIIQVLASEVPSQSGLYSNINKDHQGILARKNSFHSPERSTAESYSSKFFSFTTYTTQLPW